MFLPNPFDSGAHAVCTSDEAAASFRQTSDAAADHYGVGPCMINDLPIIRAENERKRRELLEQSEIDCIGEIFAGARKMFDPDPAAYTREDELYYDVLKAMDDPHTADLIEMPYGMEGLFDPAPLFLRQTG